MNLTTADPRFDPKKPIKVNGYLFVPSEPQRVIRIAPIDPDAPRHRPVMEVARG